MNTEQRTLVRGIPVCEVCGKPITEHVAFLTSNERAATMTQGVFEMPTSGLYCPESAS